MLNLLYVLKKQYRDKKIYIWNVNRNSMVAFTRAAFRKIDIQGFVTTQKKYVGQMYMNRPVVCLEQVEREEDALILAADEVLKSTADILSVSKMVYWTDAIEFNETLRNGKIIVYGIGRETGRLKRVLDREGVRVDLYCVTRKDYRIDQYQGVKVIEVSELERYEKEGYSIIISQEAGQERQEAVEILDSFQGQIYIQNIVGEWEITNVNLIQNIQSAIKEHKKIYLYSRSSVISRLVEEVLKLYNISVSGYVYDSCDTEDMYAESIYSLAFEGIEDKLIIINEENPERLVRARMNVEFAGFSLEEGNYTGLQWYTRAKEILLSELEDYYDSLVGFSNIYTHGKPGWKVYGQEKAKVRILILGGSTSAENNHPENWVSKLYYKLKRNLISAVIYNGAYPGNDIVDEVLRLLRDGYHLNPQIVISLSGVNNTYYKKTSNQFNEDSIVNWIRCFASNQEYCSGVNSDETLYSFWNRNISLLKLVTEFFGARFYGFLQPMNITMSQMSLWEKSTYEIEEHILGAKDFVQFASNEGEYINLMHIFEHQNEMYFDMCHYTDRANEIIADKVYETILPTIRSVEQ